MNVNSEQSPVLGVFKGTDQGERQGICPVIRWQRQQPASSLEFGIIQAGAG